MPDGLSLEPMHADPVTPEPGYERCPDCGGYGSVGTVALGSDPRWRACERCWGEGQVPRERPERTWYDADGRRLERARCVDCGSDVRDEGDGYEDDCDCWPSRTEDRGIVAEGEMYEEELPW